MSTTTTNTDVTALIEAQHEQVRQLFGRLRGVRGEAAEPTFCELRRLLAVHETAEEEIVYPALKAQGEQGQKVAEERKQEESKAKQVLADLEKMGTGAAEFAET